LSTVSARLSARSCSCIGFHPDLDVAKPRDAAGVRRVPRLLGFALAAVHRAANAVLGWTADAVHRSPELGVTPV